MLLLGYVALALRAGVVLELVVLLCFQKLGAMDSTGVLAGAC